MRNATVVFDGCQLDIWQEYEQDHWDEEGNAYSDEWSWMVEANYPEEKTDLANGYMSQAFKSLLGYIKQDDVDFGEHYLVAFMGVLSKHNVPFTVSVGGNYGDAPC